MSHSILVVDDDPIVLGLMQQLIENVGHRFTAAQTTTQARRMAERKSPDAAIVDLMLGDEDGLDLVRLWRVERRFPVLIVSSRGEPIDRVIGLEVGADDYLVKPFEPRELQLRLRIALARHSASRAFGPMPTCWSIGEGVFDPTRHAIRVGDREIALTTAEFRLIELLVRHPNQTLSRDRIMDVVHQRERHLASDRSVDMLVTRLRRKLDGDAIRIQSIRGSGYMLCGRVDRLE